MTEHTSEREKRELEQQDIPQAQLEIEAAAFRRMLAHFDERRDIQNIDLMILAGFCRNCLSKWYKSAAKDHGITLDLEAARERIYGMTYDEWKNNHQLEATAEQLAALEKSSA